MMIRNKRKGREGVVVSNKCDKTITVLITYRMKHPIYGKFIKMSKKFAVHDESNICNMGDVVAIMETRPLSKTKKWRLIKILKSATQ